MAEEETSDSADQWLSRAGLLLSSALSKSRSAASAAPGFAIRWNSVASKLGRVSACLSDLSAHPFFSKNALCLEQLQSLASALSDSVEFADRFDPLAVGKLQAQSDLDSLSTKLDLCLHDCRLLIASGFLCQTPAEELLARLQIGSFDARHCALDGLLDELRGDKQGIFASLSRGGAAALVRLLSSAKVREKAAAAVFHLAESAFCADLLVEESALPPLIRMAESGSPAGTASLERFSATAGSARAIAKAGGIRPLIECCKVGDAAAAGVLRNLSLIAELRQGLADEGAIGVMVGLLGSDARERAAEFLKSMSSGSDGLRRTIVLEGGIRGLLAYLGEPTPQEPGAAALQNLVGSTPAGNLISLGLLPKLAHVLENGSPGAQQAAASAICGVIGSGDEMRVLVLEQGCVGLLVRMLEAKSDGVREAAARAISALMSCRAIRRDVKRNGRSVPSLVQLLDPSPANTAKKNAVSCLLPLSAGSKCRKVMISHGAIGYLKKLRELDVPGSKRLLERLEKGTLIRSLFSDK